MAYKIKKTKRKRRPLSKEKKIKILSILLPIFIVLIFAGGTFFIIKENSDMLKKFFYIKDEDTVETIAELGFSTAEKKKLLTLVNLQNPIPEDYPYDLTEYKNIKIEKLVLEPLKTMIRDAKSDGIDLKLKKGFISKDEQNSMYKSEVDKLMLSGLSSVRSMAEAEKIIPPGGKSDFQTGLTIEFDFSDNLNEQDALNTDKYKWLNKNCVDYGFIIRYPKSKESETSMSFSPSIYRFVGVENAKKTRALDLCFDEYCNYLDMQKNN